MNWCEQHPETMLTHTYGELNITASHLFCGKKIKSVSFVGHF